MNRTGIVAKIEEIAERVAQPEGIEIVEVDLKGAGRHQVLRIVIDRVDKNGKLAGVTHGDCELISQQVGTILDAEDTIRGSYSLEVSSPGVERKLLKWKDWERFVGEKAKVVLREPLAAPAVPAASNPLKYFEGVIARADVDAHTVTVELSDGAAVTFPVEQVDRANLRFEW
jgi:ribosome maturation factor RimP